jgi:hypothetical protein
LWQNFELHSTFNLECLYIGHFSGMAQIYGSRMDVIWNIATI